MKGNASVRLIIIICLPIVGISRNRSKIVGGFARVVVWCGVQAENYARHILHDSEPSKAIDNNCFRPPCEPKAMESIRRFRATNCVFAIKVSVSQTPSERYAEGKANDCIRNAPFLSG